MLEKLDRLVDEITSLNSKLLLVIGSPRSGKSSILASLSVRRNATVLNVGVALGRQLIAIPCARRHLHAAHLLKDLANEAAVDDLLLLDNIELLFDCALRLSPLELLKRHAHARRVIAAWPGDFREGRLSYARIGHPEHQDYAVDGLVPFEIH